MRLEDREHRIMQARELEELDFPPRDRIVRLQKIVRYSAVLKQQEGPPVVAGKVRFAKRAKATTWELRRFMDLLVS